MVYKLLKKWESKRHGKTFETGMLLNITLDSEVEELIEFGCIPAPLKKQKKQKKNKGKWQH